MILCCGEALVDMIPEPTVSGQSGFVPHCGGAVFNTAIALGRLGTATGLLTGLSRDMFGAQLLAALQASKVDSSHVVLSDRPTTLAFVALADGHAKYSFVDENTAGRLLKTQDIAPLSSDVQALYFGGISLACEPAADTYATLLSDQGANHAVMLDPNIRLGFSDDPARYRNRLNRMMAEADIVKVSDEDLNWIVEGPASLQDKAREILDMGPAVVIITLGSEGALAVLRSGDVAQVPAKPVTVVDTVGAGDTFNAGVLSYLSQAGLLTKVKLAGLTADQITPALELGTRVAGVTVARVGANPPWADELPEATR